MEAIMLKLLRLSEDSRILRRRQMMAQVFMDAAVLDIPDGQPTEALHRSMHILMYQVTVQDLHLELFYLRLLVYITVLSRTIRS